MPQTELTTSLSRLFSSAVFREMARRGKAVTAAAVLKESGFVSDLDASAPLKTVFDAAFQVLKKKGQRHEYIYKNAIMGSTAVRGRIVL